MFKCEYCEKEYSTKSNLNHHKKTAKKCLSLRDTIENINFLICKKCDFQTTLKSSLDRHKCKSSITIDRYEKKILELENKNVILKLKLEKSMEEIVKLSNNNINLQIKIESYESKMFILASKPSCVNTRTANNIENLVISEKLKTDFTIEHLEDGIKGMARVTD